MKTAAAFIFVFVVLAGSCRKDSFITGASAELATSEDSLYFDTLFTSTGSTTQYFKIFNTNDRKLKISKIAVAGGDNSFFTINADGRKGPEVNDLEMEANDSLYVFVTVKIDPTAEDLPFVIRDSISISFNNKERWVKLSAWGQNADFLRAQVIVSDTTWTNARPIVILGGALVAEGATLNIEQGSHIYLHADAPLIIDGTLRATGEKYDSTRIIFQGDRLDQYYRDIPGSWPGIYFRETSSNNLLQQVIVKNAYQGIVCDQPSPAAGAKLTMDGCMIDNCYDAGILGVNSSIKALNCLISNCGKNILLVRGGEYEFEHCTDVCYSNIYLSHKEPVLGVTDFIEQDNVVYFGDLDAKFINCIFWGDNGIADNEVVVAKRGSGNFQAVFTNCLWKVKTEPSDVVASGTVANMDPLFEEIETVENHYNFRLKEGSPAVNAGISSGTMNDIDGNERLNIPDIGAYESAF